MKNDKATRSAADAGNQALKVFEESTEGEAAPNDAPASEKAELTRLAALSRFEYERERTEAARRLGVRVGALDDEVEQCRAEAVESARSDGILRDPEPWLHAVDAATLADAIVKQLSRFIVLPEHAAEAAALWVIHAHAHDAAEHSPILAVQSAEMRCRLPTSPSRSTIHSFEPGPEGMPTSASGQRSHQLSICSRPVVASWCPCSVSGRLLWPHGKNGIPCLA
jgi:hypothetical protein